ncbi:MAG: hypothetical protein K6G88_09400 [Lachnospiraceae bacterium]|nr:hypothetical protein [Lachnospiraceae bacterium]
MAKTSKVLIEEKRKNEFEYQMMRQILLDIASSEKATNSIKLDAIKTIIDLDRWGVPLPKGWY